MRVTVLIIIIFMLLPSLFYPTIDASEMSIKNSFIAYKSKVIPNIDGILSAHEWDDAKTYVFRWDDSMNISGDRKLIATLSLKHDEKHMYILFTINDNDTEDSDALCIRVKVLRASNSSDADTIVLFSNGKGYEEYGIKYSLSFPYAPAREIYGKTRSQYHDGFYVFEASLNLTRYFNNTGYAKAYFWYVDGIPPAFLSTRCPSVSLGDYDYVFISSEQYSGENTYDIIHNLYGGDYTLYLLGVAGILIIAVFFLIKRRKKRNAV